MKTNLKSHLSRMLVFAVVLLASTAASAYWHGGRGYYGHGYYGHGGNYQGGYYNGWRGWNGVAVGIPWGGYRYGGACYNKRVCNYKGCWIARRCY
jgi:hypothetical protein